MTCIETKNVGEWNVVIDLIFPENGNMRTKTLWIKEEYLQLILAERKTVEVRVGYSNIIRLQVGDRLLLNEKHPVIIRRIAHYQDFEDLLLNEDPSAIAPDVPAAELLEKLRAIYTPEKEAMGAVALEIEPEPRTQHGSGTAAP